jgi:diacylglycerol kinase family enzyme
MKPGADRRWAVIVNRPAPEATVELWTEIEALLRIRSVNTQVLMRRGTETVEELARRAISRGAQIIVAAGGDGTVSAVATVLSGTSAVLGILPAGTLNHFARDLGIPLEIEPALEIIAGGNVVRVDVGEVNGRVFVNNSSLGLYPKLVEARASLQAGGWSKRAALAWATLRVLGAYSTVTFEVKAEGTVTRYTTPVVMIGNNEYRVRGLELGTRPKLDGGKLGVYIVRNSGRLKFALMWLRALLGRVRPGDELELLRCSELEIRRRGRLVRVALDGEVERFPSPLRYRIRPGALLVTAPPK